MSSKAKEVGQERFHVRADRKMQYGRSYALATTTESSAYSGFLVACSRRREPGYNNVKFFNQIARAAEHRRLRLKIEGGEWVSSR